jgi:hypothetical protein
MLKIQNKLLLAALLAAVSFGAMAIDMGAVIKAQAVLGQVDQIMKKYAEVQALLDGGSIELDVEQPIEGVSGKYVLPFDDEGNLTAWAEKSLTAKAGSEVAGAAGDKAAGMLAAKVPFGGLAGGFMKSKSKEVGAVVAIGGWDFIKENSTHSFNNLDDYSVYLHDQFHGTAEYEGALAAAMAVYPKLEKSHKKSVDKAYKDAKKRWKKMNK